MDELRRRFTRLVHGNGSEPIDTEAVTLDTFEIEIKPSELAIADIRAQLHELGRLAAMGELSDWETEALGDIAERALDAWRAAVAVMVGRIIAG